MGAPRLDERAQCGRVDELDLGQVDDEPRPPAVDGICEPRLDLLDVVEVEVAAKAHHECVSDLVHTDYRLLARPYVALGHASIQAEYAALCKRGTRGTGSMIGR